MGVWGGGEFRAEGSLGRKGVWGGREGLRARSSVASSVTKGSSHQIGTQRGSLDASSHKGHEFDLYFGKYSRDRQLEHKNEKYLASTLNQYPFFVFEKSSTPSGRCGDFRAAMCNTKKRARPTSRSSMPIVWSGGYVPS